MKKYGLNDIVEVKFRGKIASISNDYSDKMTRYFVTGGHCIHATVLDSALHTPKYPCADCGRMYEIEEFVDRYIPQYNDVPDHEIICKECAGIRKEDA